MLAIIVNKFLKILKHRTVKDILGVFFSVYLSLQELSSGKGSGFEFGKCSFRIGKSLIRNIDYNFICTESGYVTLMSIHKQLHVSTSR